MIGLFLEHFKLELQLLHVVLTHLCLHLLGDFIDQLVLVVERGAQLFFQHTSICLQLVEIRCEAPAERAIFDVIPLECRKVNFVGWQEVRILVAFF